MPRAGFCASVSLFSFSHAGEQRQSRPFARAGNHQRQNQQRAQALGASFAGSGMAAGAERGALRARASARLSATSRHVSSSSGSGSSGSGSGSEGPSASSFTHFCDACGTETAARVPEGDNRERQVCPDSTCGKIHYVNPKTVVGCLVEHRGRGGGGKRQVLLCRRGIEPCRGLWTLPAGFQECGESTCEGAARETREEANASVSAVQPYAHLSIPLISQSYLIFRATLQVADGEGPSPGDETLETRLFDVDALPFDEIAFSSMKIILQDFYLEDLKRGRYSFHHGTIDKHAGVVGHSARANFTLRDYTRLATDHSVA